MSSSIVNGYNVTGNHGAGSDRVYHVSNAAGRVMVADGMAQAFAFAEGLPPGDVAEVVPEPDVKPSSPRGDLEPEWEPDAPTDTDYVDAIT